MVRSSPNSKVCYDPSILYKAEGMYPPPQGFRAESFIIPFSFNVLANGELQSGFPWKLDDDVPWVFRGMLWPQCGTAEAINTGGLTGNPMLVRVYDTNGNPLTNCPTTNNLVLSMGAIGQSGFNSINAFGFPFGCEIQCEPGGVITFDFLIPYPTPTQLVVQGTMLGCKLFKVC